MSRRAVELDRRSVFLVLAVLAVLVVLNVPELGTELRPFRPGAIEPTGPLAWLVRLADSEWDVGILRAAALLAGLLVAVAGIVALRVQTWRWWVLATLAAVVVCLLLVPAVLLQLGLRQSSAPWFFTNDSTYQIELAGQLVLDGDNPYGHDYGFSGLERFYSFDGSASDATRREQVALRHLPYFPGTPLSAAAWRVLRPRSRQPPARPARHARRGGRRPSVPRATLGRARRRRGARGEPARGPRRLVRRRGRPEPPLPRSRLRSRIPLSGGRSRCVSRRRRPAQAVRPRRASVPRSAASPRGVRRDRVYRAGAAFLGVLLAGFLPFLIADAGALWNDTVSYGAGTYRIIGYGLAGILVELSVIEERTDPYPFAYLAAFVWLPLTAWLVWTQLRARALWVGAAAFSISMFVLLYLGRVLQNSYLVWPLAGIGVALLLSAPRAATPPPEAPRAG